MNESREAGFSNASRPAPGLHSGSKFIMNGCDQTSDSLDNTK
jgi:hypothetical protein